MKIRDTGEDRKFSDDTAQYTQRATRAFWGRKNEGAKHSSPSLSNDHQSMDESSSQKMLLLDVFTKMLEALKHIGIFGQLLCFFFLFILDTINNAATTFLVYAGVSSFVLFTIVRIIIANIFNVSVGYVLQKTNKKHSHILLLLVNLLYVIINIVYVISSPSEHYVELNLGVIIAAIILFKSI